MQTQCIPEQMEFQGLGKRKVVADFSGGEVTSDTGGLLLREVEKGAGILSRFAECFVDYRAQDLVEHSVAELVSQRVYGIALVYEDLNDHDDLRNDALLATLVGKTDLHRCSQATQARQGLSSCRQEHPESTRAGAGRSRVEAPLSQDRLSARAR